MIQSLMAWIVIFCLLFALDGGGTLAAEAPGKSSAVAVLDFEMSNPEENADPDNWSLGLSDYLELLLINRNCRLETRMFVNQILRERNLLRKGIVNATDLQLTQLPWVRYLVKGSMEKKNKAEFRLSVSLIDTKSAQELKSWSVEGAYPKELGTMLESVAQSLSAVLHGNEPVGAKHKENPGFTKVPEVAIIFYRAMDHLLNGRPGYAVHYFDQAHALDRGFWLARTWQMRSYEILGLPKLSEVTRSYAEKLRNKNGANRPGQGEQQKLRVIARFLNRTKDFTAIEIGQIKTALREKCQWSVFEPDWIDEIISEKDLQISEEIARDREMSAWLDADATLLFSKSGPWGSSNLQASISSIGTGALLATYNGSVAEPGAFCLELSKRMGQAKTAATKTAQSLSLGSGLPNGSDGKISSTRYVRDRAQWLESYAADQKNLYKLFRLAKETRGEPWKNELDSHLQDVLLDELVGLQDADEKMKPYWEAYVLICKRIKHYDTPGKRRPAARAKDSYGDYLQRHPNLWTSHLMQFEIAMEMMADGELRAAKALLETLLVEYKKMLKSQDFPMFLSQVPVPGQGFHRSRDCRKENVGNACFQLAYVNYKLGEQENARKYLDEIKEEMDGPAFKLFGIEFNQELNAGHMRYSIFPGNMSGGAMGINFNGKLHMNLRSAAKKLNEMMGKDADDLPSAWAKISRLKGEEKTRRTEKLLEKVCGQGKLPEKDWASHEIIPKAINILAKNAKTPEERGRCKILGLKVAQVMSHHPFAAIPFHGTIASVPYKFWALTNSGNDKEAELFSDESRVKWHEQPSIWTDQYIIYQKSKIFNMRGGAVVEVKGLLEMIAIYEDFHAKKILDDPKFRETYRAHHIGYPEDLYLVTAKIQMKINDLAGALNTCRRGLAFYPVSQSYGFYHTRWYYAELLLKDKQVQEAIRVLKEIVDTEHPGGKNIQKDAVSLLEKIRKMP